MPRDAETRHYENFPVASFLLPAHLRPAVRAIYAFARSADDIADEGDLPAQERLRLLEGYRAELDKIERGEPSEHPLFDRLRLHIAAHHLPLEPFRDLLAAFSQDVVKTRYADYAELADYCRRSANPIGRLLLHLFAAATAENLADSDAICTALQLINHWQDLGIDLAKPVPRIYLPQDELARFGISEDELLRRRPSAEFRALMAFQIARARDLLLQGAPLCRRLPGRIGLELRAIIAGGLMILEKIEAVDYDVFNRRPTLSAFDWPRLITKALLFGNG
ncbi:MAG: squalene synthase HpnC [Rhodocyclaceae bacterium]|nr:squalene synthase HpnC [Rhodocyclaceae bacterium]